MNKHAAYTIAIVAGAALAALVTWLVDHDLDAAIVSSVFGAVFSSITLGNALRGSIGYMGDERDPLSTRGRWIFGGIGVAIVIGFALLLPVIAARTR